MDKTHALDIPEVLSLVLSFVPLWEGSPYYEQKFVPHDVLSCTCVSKVWRQISLPFLWEVYSFKHMSKIPVDVLFQNSVYFRYLCQSTSFMHPDAHKQLWLKHASGQPALKCTSLESFSFIRHCLPQQLELLRTNPGVVSLDWWQSEFSSSDLRTIYDGIKPFAASIKDLHFHPEYDDARPDGAVSLLQLFPNVEHFHMGTPFYKIISRYLTTWRCTAGIRIETLKKLTFTTQLQRLRQLEAILSIFSHCRQIEHLVLHLCTDRNNRVHNDTFSFYDFVQTHKTVLAWRSQIYDSSSEAKDSSSGTTLKDTLQLLPQETHRGLDKLDIYFYSLFESSAYCIVQFQQGCQNPVRLQVNLRTCRLQVFSRWFRSFNLTLKEVDLLDIEPGLGLQCIGLVLGSLPELQHFACVVTGEMTNADSFALFRGQFPATQAEDSTGAEDTTNSHIISGWVCHHLKSLSIRGLWRTGLKDRPNKGRRDITLQAASENYQWVACGPTKFGKHFIATISDRIRTLPELRTLTLDSTTFDYSKIISETA